MASTQQTQAAKGPVVKPGTGTPVKKEDGGCC